MDANETTGLKWADHLAAIHIGVLFEIGGKVPVVHPQGDHPNLATKLDQAEKLDYIGMAAF